MGNILVTASHFQTLCQDAIKLLERNGHQVILNNHDMPYYSFDELAVWAPEIDGAIIGMDQWNEAVFQLAPKLKILARFGVGVDNIDLEAAKRHGVQVVNAAGMNANAVAELAVAMILNCLRGIPQLYQRLTAGEWARAVGRDIQGKTVGLLGFGDIGGRVARKLSSMDVRLMAYDPYPNREKAQSLGVVLADMDTILSQSDIVSIHMPSIPATYHIMNRETFRRMKPGSWLINTARGALVDTEALIDAVTCGHLAGAALDVFEQEPLPLDAPVLHTPGILCTPHAGAETAETYQSISMMTAQAVIDSLSGKTPQNWLNK